MDIVKEISEQSGKSEKEIRRLIQQKEDELSGLVSETGAAHIVARELGIKLLKKIDNRLCIKNIILGMSSVNVYGMVIKISEIRNFIKKDKTTGKVASFVLADETGSVRVVLWNDETDVIEKFKIGSIIEVSGYTRESMNKKPEIALGRSGQILKKECANFPSIEELQRMYMTNTSEIVNISELKDGNENTIMACLVQIFTSNCFYEICPECDKRVKKIESEFSCPEHGIVNPKFSIVLSGVVDDGTGNIRIVFFRNIAEKLIGMKTEEVIKMKDNIFDLARKNIGKEFIFSGIIKKNKLFENLEFISRSIEDVNVKKESERLINNLNKMIKELK